MKTYDKTHWVTDQVVTGSTDFDTMGAIASDLSEAKDTLNELVAHYLTSGATLEDRAHVREIMGDVFDEHPATTVGDEPKYHFNQVRSSYVVMLAAADLAHFMEAAVREMMNHGDINGYVND